MVYVRGRLGEAQQSFERALQFQFATDDRQPAFWSFPVHHPSTTRAMLAEILWLRGFAEQALDEAKASLDESSAPDHQLSVCRILAFGICRIATMTGELVTADQQIARLIELSTRLDAPFWQATGRLLEGKLMVQRRAFAEALTTLRDAFEMCRQTGHFADKEFKGAFAEAFAGVGQFDAALVAVDEAIASAGQPDAEVRYLPELLRIKGEVLLRQAADRSQLAAEDCFNRAAEMARQQGALFWELRIAVSLARLRVAQRREDAAREILLPVYQRFTEDFGTADLRAAKAFLSELRG